MMEFPRLVYRSATSYTLVADQTEFDAAIAAGWYASVPECSGAVSECVPVTDPIAPALDPDVENAAPTRDELEQKAQELGIGFNGNTKDETLIKKIEEALTQDS